MSNSRLRKQQQPRALRNILPTPVILVLGGVVLIAGALFALWKSGQPATPKVPVEVNGSPRLKVDRETVDLGDVPLDKTVTVSFQLTNVGDKTLRFSDEPTIEVLEGC